VKPGVVKPDKKGVDIVGAGIMAALITGIASLLLPKKAPSASHGFYGAEESLKQAHLQFDY